MKAIYFILICLGIFMQSNQIYAQEMLQYKIDDYTVYILPEDILSANTGIFRGASPEDIKKYMDSRNFPMYLNVVLIKSPKHNILIDGGYGSQLFNHLEKLNISPEEIDHILLTHMHPDHIGGLIKDNKAAFPNATLWLAKQEKDYWTDKQIQNSQTKMKQQGFIDGQNLLALYGEKVQTFNPNHLGESPTILENGIKAISAFGHTPGHTAFSVGKDENEVIIWGDLVHVQKIQLPLPRVSLIFDVDSEQAIATRLEMLEFIEKNGLKVIGMHLDPQGISRLQKSGDGYKLVNP